MDRVIVAFESEHSRLHVRDMLEREGIFPALCTGSGAAALRAALNMGGGVLVCGYKLADMSASELGASLPQGAVMLLVAPPAQLDMYADDDIFRLASPVSRGDLAASVRILQQLERRGTRRPDSQQQRILAAKQLLMRRDGIDEQQAHRLMQKQSMDSGARLIDVAEDILRSMK